MVNSTELLKMTRKRKDMVQAWDKRVQMWQPALVSLPLTPSIATSAIFSYRGVSRWYYLMNKVFKK